MTQKPKWTPQVGDRVAIKQDNLNARGTIVGKGRFPDYWMVELHEVAITVQVYRAKLRRLVKKKKPEKRKPREVWVNFYFDTPHGIGWASKEVALTNLAAGATATAVKFVEVME